MAGLLGVADELYFGVPGSELGRLARLEDAQGSAEVLASMPDDSPFFKAAPRAVSPTADFGNRPDVLMADIPAGAKMSARAVARMYAALLGEMDDAPLVSPGRLVGIRAVAFSGVDEVVGFPVARALGYDIGRPSPDAPDTPTVFGMGGAGGTYAYADAATGTAFALTKNRLTIDLDAVERVDEIITKAVADG